MYTCMYVYIYIYIYMYIHTYIHTYILYYTEAATSAGAREGVGGFPADPPTPLLPRKLRAGGARTNLIIFILSLFLSLSLSIYPRGGVPADTPPSCPASSEAGAQLLIITYRITRAHSILFGCSCLFTCLALSL